MGNTAFPPLPNGDKGFLYVFILMLVLSSAYIDRGCSCPIVLTEVIDMKLLFLPLLVSSIAFADVDTLYSVSFSDPGGEWSWGSSWEVCPDFIQLYLSHYNYSGYAEESDSL
ncbi:MAG TPA: hypothetical protein P5207_02500 [Candidatus Sabulitectum sp.]|nr:hypothetical protein [Candidatus Sabulitectum sp.]